MTVHIEEKVVTRHELWCDECGWHAEYSDKREAYERCSIHRRTHPKDNS